ncbi:hypothetical protein ACW0TQ_04920 [Oceanobacillus sp. M60]|uniref:hypothetical protein n=1 Tax=Oceanobacillus sp. FSL K6-0251 TaxID=2921602 RepID=UPI0030FBAD3B
MMEVKERRFRLPITQTSKAEKQKYFGIPLIQSRNYYLKARENIQKPSVYKAAGNISVWKGMNWKQIFG